MVLMSERKVSIRLAMRFGCFSIPSSSVDISFRMDAEEVEIPSILPISA